MSKTLSFQPRARLLLQLGDQLIRNESVALLELIKNSYDAYASTVTITMTKADSLDDGEIIIEDDGIGMTEEIIKNVWMQPGSDYKSKIVNSIKKRTKGQRVPIGEKGIGRFGVHKLGNSIELISRTESGKEVYLKINWRQFEKDTELQKVKVNLIERKAEYFKGGKSGTLIKIRDLKKKWDRSSVREIYRSATSLSSPFGTLDAFNVFFKLDDQDWLKGLIKYNEIKEYALYHADGVIEGNRLTEFKYEFTPWDSMTKLDGRKCKKSNLKMVEEVRDENSRKKKQVSVDISKLKVGEIKVKIAIFDRDPRILNFGVTDKEGLKNYLDLNGGMRVFRDGIRIFNYGEKDNDWLKLDIKRVNRPGETISNNLFIGAVYLDRLDSTGLKEKTNREGFIEDDAYDQFQKSINFFLDKVLTERKIDKDKLRKIYGSTSVSEPVIGKLKELKTKVALVVPKAHRNDILKTIKGIEEDYNSITSIYTRSSAAGLSLSIVIHEVEKIVSELIHAVEEIPTNKYFSDLINTLGKTVNDYASFIRQSARAKEDLMLLLDRAISSIQFRLKAHGILIVNKYKERANVNTSVKCTANLFISSIINLIDNSIWWMNYANKSKRKIYIDILTNYEGYLSVLIADNGPGFSIPPEEAVKPFISDKPDGMGLGLHLADTMMTTLKGKMFFPQEHDLKIPQEFQAGAKIVMAFKL